VEARDVRVVAAVTHRLVVMVLQPQVAQVETVKTFHRGQAQVQRTMLPLAAAVAAHQRVVRLVRVGLLVRQRERVMRLLPQAQVAVALIRVAYQSMAVLVRLAKCG